MAGKLDAGREMAGEIGLVFGRQVGAADQEPGLVREPGQRAGLDRGREQAGADRTAAGADDDGRCVGGGPGIGVVEDEARVQDAGGQPVGVRKAQREGEQQGVAMDQHGIVPALGEVEHPVVLRRGPAW